MKLRASARILKKKAVSSFKRSVDAFNSVDDNGRMTTVLLHAQHSFEMLLKAALNQKQVNVFDKSTGRSIGFEQVLRQAAQTVGIKLTDEEAGTLRAIDALRDDEQHWYNDVDEALLYVHLRAAVTLFDDLLQRVFSEHLADHLPRRILPISTEPPKDFQVLVDSEYTKIIELLKPGRRAGAEARARIRTLLAMEAHAEPETIVSDKDVTRVEAGIREGKERTQVFPRLSKVGASISGEGLEVQVRFVKHQDALAVRFTNDEEIDAAAIRTVDQQKKYHWTAFALADALGISRPRGTALRTHLGINNDPNICHTFTFSKQKHVRFSDQALVKMKAAMQVVDMGVIWNVHSPTKKHTAGVTDCGQYGCTCNESAAGAN
ncbi:DUF3644 domain-containing protein [Frigoribacterium sp. Leaf8]|uniref:DUF3644 domain-containing protein n=1 Tax=Frigoribacterium sp. Leaf8 TaxID=1735673 RepID=UPI0019102647|nr:DUF3644 domain-containing protein [Frigoribacterium sp. Leaf8]